MNFIKKTYKAIVPKKVRRYIDLRILLKHKDREKYDYYKQWYPKRVSYGRENKNKVFYVIRVKEKATGLLSCYLTALTHLKKIDGKQKYYPIVDMKTVWYKLISDENSFQNGINGWNLFFEDVSSFGMDDIKASRHVYLSDGIGGPHDAMFFDSTKIDREFIANWTAIDRKYIRLKRPLLEGFESKATVFDGKRVLGTMVRESYIVLANARDANDPLYKTHPGIGGHPKQPELEKMIADLEALMKKFDCPYIFLVCQASCVEDRFREYFGDRLITSGRQRRKVDRLDLKEWIEAPKQIKGSVYENNVAYLEEIFLLSKCTSLASGKCSGAIVAALWNRGEYENLEIFQEGVY